MSIEGGKRDNSYSTYTKFFEKLTFRPDTYTYVRDIRFSENFASVLNGWSQR